MSDLWGKALGSAHGSCKSPMNWSASSWLGAPASRIDSLPANVAELAYWNAKTTVA